MQLVLADGTIHTGKPFGADRPVRGEVVFNTGMTGYVETLTDPSYRGQILVTTYPLQGNYGVPDGPFEHPRIQVQGLVVSHYSDHPSHFAAVRSLGDWLRSENIPAIQGVDTRALTRRLRAHGTMDGYLLNEVSDAAKAAASAIDMPSVVELVAPREIVRYPDGDLTVLVIDTGAKENIIRSLQKRGAAVVRAPFFANWEPLLAEVDGVMLTNGPGDPSDMVVPLVERLRGILAAGLPTFGICLGHQLLALAAGAETYKLKFGHRSHNQPVMDVVTRHSYVTSQNHGFAVRNESLPHEWEPWFVNLNDHSNEGIRHRYRPFRSVQFHPEAAAGPRDTAYLFDDFLRMVGEMRKVRLHEGNRSRLPAFVP
ncbi:MAG: carbamoyl-phosphate synthase (glutamine-hydrolyzing) small subunit [Myxococcales bacterium]|nr:carbamoyl-phosphate synthase (glutamine-hydrolyzing) small subunit [Myxococcales bacterium]